MSGSGTEAGRYEAVLPSAVRAEAIPLKEIAKVLLNLFKDQLAGFLLIFRLTGVFL
ncbi:hypothetical protein ES703_24099 [subsurface metagenome]